MNQVHESSTKNCRFCVRSKNRISDLPEQDQTKLYFLTKTITRVLYKKLARNYIESIVKIESS